MAGSIEEYKKKYYTDTQESHNKSLKVLEDTKARDDKLAKETYDLNEKDINNYYGTRITDAEDSYEMALKQNEVQKILNERAVERRMAEMGLTDSGLNRTQSTAVQLSYANHKGDLIEQRQKEIDTLAAAMTSDLAKNKLKYNTTLATNQNTYDTSVATLNTNRDNDAYTYGVNAHNADVEAENKAIENQKTDYNNLYTLIKNNNDLNYAAKLIYEYADKYDIDENGPEYKILLDAAGLSEDEMKHYLANGSVYSVGSSYASNIANKSPVGRVQWDYNTDGKMKYKFKLTKATNNGGNWWGLFDTVDNDDEVTIYYPDGKTILAENVRIDQLPENIRLDITHKTAKQKKGYEFEAEVDLNGLKLK